MFRMTLENAEWAPTKTSPGCSTTSSAPTTGCGSY
jgi:hypothetical protein